MPYAPPPVQEPTEGAYHLHLLETVRGRLLDIAISEFGTEPGYVLGTEPQTHASALNYQFQMEWQRALPQTSPGAGRPGWSLSVGYSYLTFGNESVGATSAQLRQAIAVTKQAALHLPVNGQSNLAQRAQSAGADDLQSRAPQSIDLVTAAQRSKPNSRAALATAGTLVTLAF
jgi:hypothetical protein